MRMEQCSILDTLSFTWNLKETHIDIIFTTETATTFAAFLATAM